LDGSDDLLFDLSSSDLKPAAERLLKKLGPVLGKIPNSIQIHGHTDARPFPKGSPRDNWILSFERAHRARQLLDQSGLHPGQVVGVFAHGSSAPLDRDARSARNRRIAILAVRRGVEPDQKSLANLRSNVPWIASKSVASN
jgi:chemotaxis protein MotB